MRFKEMKTEDRKQLIKGHKDVLTPLVEADRQIYEGVTCPQCAGMTTKEFDFFRTITSPRVIPRYNLRCLECDCLFEPITGLVVGMGNRGKLHPETLVPIIDPSGGH